MKIKREDIYKKELTLKMSTSYGPGRYDSIYEEGGVDYPKSYVRFTEKRNVESYLGMIAQNKVVISNIPRSTFSIDDAEKAFDVLKQSNPPMVSLLDYTQLTDTIVGPKVIIKKNSRKRTKGVGVGFIGAGSYVQGMHLPNFQRLGNLFYVKGIMNRSVIPAASLVFKYGLEYYTMDYHDILEDSDIELVMICTHHDSHAMYSIEALKAGKHVFVEKPIAMNQAELTELLTAIKQSSKKFFVGYNRRFSVYTKEIKRCLADRKSAVHIEYTMNSGYIPYDTWVHNKPGGGRIIGEGCHIIDLMQAIIGAKAKELISVPINSGNDYLKSSDNVSFMIIYEDGSSALIRYISSGAKTYPKETMVLTCGEKIIYLNDYTDLTAINTRIKRIHNSEPDKGQLDILKAVYKTIRENGTKQLIPLDELEVTSKITFNVAKSTHALKGMEFGKII